jgi:hypothetical protein
MKNKDYFTITNSGAYLKRSVAILLLALLPGCRSSSESGAADSTSGLSSETVPSTSEQNTSNTHSDCSNAPATVTCLAGFVATQGFGVVEIDAAMGRSPIPDGANVAFLDAADFADRFVPSVIIPRLRQQYQVPLNGLNEWQIEFNPEITRKNFGEGFVVDLQGPQAITSDMRETGLFQITGLRQGRYALRLYKEFRLTYVQPASGERHTDCVVIDWYRSDIDIGANALHLELGAIDHYSFYVRRGSECGESASPSSTSSNGSTGDRSIAGSGIDIPQRTSTSSSSTNIVPKDVPVTKFGSPIRRFCHNSLQRFAPSYSTYIKPWVVYREDRELMAQKLDPDSSTLDPLGVATTLNSGPYICGDPAYSQELVQATAGSRGLLATWNCTGDGMNRFWRVVLGSENTYPYPNHFVGDSIDYQSCSFSEQVDLYRCGSRLFGPTMLIDRMTSLPSANTPNSWEQGIFEGFLVAVDNHLKRLRANTGSSVSLDLNGNLAGLAESYDGSTYAYDGRVLQRIDSATFTATTVGVARPGTEAFYSVRPLLLALGNHLVAAGRVGNTMLIERIDMTPKVKLSGLTQLMLPHGEGEVYPLVTRLGTRLVAVVKATDGCQELSLSDLLPK